ncbi:hypothetical protein BC835DRAFT_1262208 [Cytidiella melzeri]|nr:hypothetical protein BC835DRAFT_1262208 [Cytidiella melzeri]
MFYTTTLALFHALAFTKAAAAYAGIQKSLSLATETESCKQTSALFPKQTLKLDETLEQLFNTNAFQTKAYDALSAVVRVPTVSHEEFLPVGQDPRWEAFGDLHVQLESLFPLVFKSLNVTKVNTYNLVLHWQGTSRLLKPILMTAHQDVVPVEPSTVDQWLHPPFSGHNDGTWIWGRGSCDDKPDIISQLSTVESLLTHGFKPTRTFVFAFGIDEESAGRNGAGAIAKYLEATYGQDSFAALLDEGFGFAAQYGGDVLFAGPATGEKGYLDVRVEVSTPGGHSSVPPRHTAIGILASTITSIESSPHPVALPRTGTAFRQIQCEAEFGPNVSPIIRELVEHARHNDTALQELARVLVETDEEGMGRIYEALMTTTQAVDLVQGGVKVNALPERVEAVVNHRIAEQSSVSELMHRFTATVLPVAKRYNLTLTAFGSVAYGGGAGKGEIVLSDAWGTALEPAPRTPTNAEEDGDARAYEVLMGTIKAALKTSPKYKDRKVVVMPKLALGMLFFLLHYTKSYWKLTRNIFRYGHSADGASYNGAHTVNEALRADALIEKIRFHTKWILNWDEVEYKEAAGN